METDSSVMASLVGVLGAIFGGGAAGGTLLLRQRKRNGATDRTGEILLQLHAIETILRDSHQESLRRSDAVFKNLDDLASSVSHLSGYVEAMRRLS
jgi:hypothetical protein